MALSVMALLSGLASQRVRASCSAAGNGLVDTVASEKCFTLEQYDKISGVGMKPFLVFSLIFFAIGSAWGQQAENTQPIEQRMSPAEFKAAGLDKLNKAELQQLNNWINGVKTVYVEKRVEVEKPKESTEDVNSQLVGEFKGWRGNTTFTLQNGQVWQQTDSSELYASKLSNPKVRVVYSSFSGWKLQVDGYNSWVKVKRVK
jgi:hypothetical protein